MPRSPRNRAINRAHARQEKAEALKVMSQLPIDDFNKVVASIISSIKEDEHIFKTKDLGEFKQFIDFDKELEALGLDQVKFQNGVPNIAEAKAYIELVEMHNKFLLSERNKSRTQYKGLFTMLDINDRATFYQSEAYSHYYNKNDLYAMIELYKEMLRDSFEEESDLYHAESTSDHIEEDNKLEQERKEMARAKSSTNARLNAINQR